MKKIILLTVTALALTSCEQYFTRNLGGTTIVELDKEQRLMEITWKGNEMWILTEPMDSDYIPKAKTFYESSLFGVMEGKVIIKETK